MESLVVKERVLRPRLSSELSEVAMRTQGRYHPHRPFTRTPTVYYTVLYPVDVTGQ